MTEITKLPCFVVDIPVECMREWRQRYEDYRQEMKIALDQCGEGKDDSANEVFKKYKKVRLNSNASFNLFLQPHQFFHHRFGSLPGLVVIWGCRMRGEPEETGRHSQ